MTRKMTLPETAVEVLAGRCDAEQIAQMLVSAYWLHGRDDSCSLFLLQKAHDEFAKLADALGYDVTPKAAPEVEAAA
jgi:hypothetical protein